MVSVTQKSGSFVLLLLSLTPSILPPLPFFFTVITASVWPALALAALRTPKAVTPPVGDTNKSTLVLPATISNAFTYSEIKTSSTSKLSSNYFSLATITTSSARLMSSTSTVSVSLFDQTSPRDVLRTSPTASTKAVSPWFGKKASLSPCSPHCRPVPHCLLRPLKQNSRLPPHPCKRLTLSLKTMEPPSHKNLQSPLSKMSLNPVSSKKVPEPQSPLLSTSNSTLPRKGLPPSNPPNKRLSAASASSSLTTFSSLMSKTSPPPLAKISPIPLLKTSPPPSEGTSFRQPGLPPLRSLPHTTGPLFEHQPFIVSWNIPDLVCNRYNIFLDTSPFKGVATPAKVPGQFLSLFYTDRLGLYPHVDLTSRKQVYGGIPQRGNLKACMNKARADINYYIPSKTSRGLAVIDWEEWRPLWDRNWGTKRIYQTLSVAHVMQTNRSLTMEQAAEKAKQQFQLAARSLMSGMLAMGRAMRPNYLWGFYLFPNCYNYGWLEPDYTGRCSKEVRRQNDELLWLWESSTALYPSVYLQASLADNPRAALMVRNRVQEALRVSTLPRQSGTAPVFVYMRPVFVDQNRRFLSQGDLVNTIGESAAVGASGAVLWGASADYDDQASCESLSSYLSSTLNPYVTNVTAAAQLCSNFLCRGNGRCVRKNYNSNHYLHLNPENFRVMYIQNRYLVLGRPTFADLKTLSSRFTCQCYKGLSCTPRTYSELAKVLIYSVKQGLHQKAHTLNKAVLDDTQQASITKDNVKKNLKV
ncbi:hyaluronidase PH-20-like isoform X2 [Trachinotus anak]